MHILFLLSSALWLGRLCYGAVVFDQVQPLLEPWQHAGAARGQNPMFTLMMGHYAVSEKNLTSLCQDDNITDSCVWYSKAADIRRCENQPVNLMERPNNNIVFGERTYSGTAYLSIFNGTPYKMHIPSGSAIQVFIQFGGRNNHMGSGDAYYELEGSHQRRFHIKAFVHPRRAPYGARHVVEVVHTQLPTRDVRKGDTVRLRFPGPGVRGRTMQWGLVGSEADGMWSSYNPPLTWMQRSLHVIGDRKLKHVCMPGSHNAGMSRISGQSFFATPGNTQNQILDIYQQLMRGSRWLDIRPCLGNGGKVMLCHYSVRFGGNGVSVDDAVNQINRFMRDFPGELVILDVNADSAYDTDNNYARLSPVQWNSILPKFNKIQRPCIVKGSLADATMSSLIGDGQGCVAVVKRSPVQQIENRPHGIYSQDSLPHFNVWSDTPNHEQMALDQIRKLQTNRAIGDELDPNTRDQFHVLSWFITPPPMSLRRRWRQPQLVNVAAETLSTLSSFGMREFSPYAFPNVLYVDGFGMPNGAVVAGTRMSRKEKFEASGAHMVALAMAVNYAIVSRNCYVGGLQLE